MKGVLLFALVFGASLGLLAQDLVTPAESERNDGVILRWNNDEAIDSTVARITAILSHGSQIYLLLNDVSASPVNTVVLKLLQYGTDTSNVDFIQALPENPWVGDYGPMINYNIMPTGIVRHIVDCAYGFGQQPSADLLPVELASYLGMGASSIDLQLEPSNLLPDGIGRVFVGDKVLMDNPAVPAVQVEQQIYTGLGLNEAILLPSIPACGGHGDIGRLVKFLDPETVMVASFPDTLPYYAEVELLADQLAHTINDVGKPFHVVRIAAAPVVNGRFALAAGEALGSYTSAVLFNDKVLVPQYGTAQDAAAIETYQKALPGFDVQGINALSLSKAGGSLNRLVRPMPQTEMLRIRHSKITQGIAYSPETWINVFAASWNSPDSIIVHFRIHPSTTYQGVNTIGCCGGNSGNIANYQASDTISYYITAYLPGHVQNLPLAAPQAEYTFWFDPFAVAHDGTAESKALYPNPASDWVSLPASLQTPGKRIAFDLFDLNGKRVYSSNFADGVSASIPERLQDGFYLLGVNSNGKPEYLPLIVKH